MMKKIGSGNMNKITDKQLQSATVAGKDYAKELQGQLGKAVANVGKPKAKPTTTTPDVIKIPKNEVLPSKFLNPKKIEPGLPVKPVKPGKPVKPETPGLKITTAPKIGVPSIRGPTTTGPKGPGPTGPSGRPIGFGLPFFGDLFPGGGGDSVGRQGKIRGQRIYKAWNVDTKNIGFLDGPEVKIDTTGEVFSDLDVRQKEKKRKGDFGI